MNNWSEKYVTWLFKYTVFDSSFFFLTTSQLSNITGFSSLYAVIQEDADAMETTNSFAGFKGTVWSPTLTLDFDTEESGLEAWERICFSRLEASLYKSGGKGYHIVIFRPHAPSHLLPLIDKEWVQNNYPKADSSIYSSLHLIRLEGTIHDKTGNKKAFVKKNEGQALILPNNVTKLPTIEESVEFVTDTSQKSVFLDSYITNMTVPHDEGNRHQALLNVGLALKSRGESIGFICRWLVNMNLMFTIPKSGGEVARIIDFIQAAE